MVMEPDARATKRGYGEKGSKDWRTNRKCLGKYTKSSRIDVSGKEGVGALAFALNNG